MDKLSHMACAAYVFFVLSLSMVFPAYAQNLPGAADPSRIKPFSREFGLSGLSIPNAVERDFSETVQIPEGTSQIDVEIKKVNVEGVTAFDSAIIENIYAQYLNKNVPLSSVWIIAEKVTRLYQDNGYFLSRAYVPAQEIDQGIVTIRVVEGFVGAIEFDNDEFEKHYIIRKLVEELESIRPLSADDLEAFALQMNALPGWEFRAFIEPVRSGQEGMVRVSMISDQEDPTASFVFDNHGSRFLGPYVATATYEGSFLPLQKTTMSALSSIPMRELRYAALEHRVPIYPNLQARVFGSYTTSEPGGSLKINNIESSSVQLGLGMQWHLIRQRDKNLSTSFELSGQNTNGDILDGNPLTRDRIRAFRARLDYSGFDKWKGYSSLSFNLSKGLRFLGASEAGDLNLSRAQAKPDFTTARIDLARQQTITKNITATTRVSGQVASGPVLSAEEFGYGGQSFGRAYDPSEILGDEGVAASLELNYHGLSPIQGARITPYLFYDIGKVWNEDTNGISESGSSAGFGVRFNLASGLNSNIGLAVPLTREISNPIYGNQTSSRLMFQIGYQF